MCTCVCVRVCVFKDVYVCGEEMCVCVCVSVRRGVVGASCECARSLSLSCVCV